VTRRAFLLTDWPAAAALWAATVVIFGVGAARLGFYYDDSSWMSELPALDLTGVWNLALNYIPGRPLFVLWQYLFFQLAGDPADSLAALHLIQSALDGLVVVCFFFLLRLLRVPASAALIAAALFSFWPTHGQTHFWNTSVAANLVPALLVVLFAASSLVFFREREPRWWMWLLDACCFLGPLFTYEQPFFVLLGLAVARVAIAVLGRNKSRWRFAICHLPHFAAAGTVLWLKLGDASVQGLFSWRRFAANLLDTTSHNLGPLWFRSVSFLYQHATAADWLLALAAGAVLACLAWRLSSREAGEKPPAVPIFAAALLFYIAAYLPVWIWHVAARHHYLPSIGLFAGAAACLALLTQRAARRRLRPALIVAAGVVTAALAAANRGESRIWEQSYELKKNLFEEIRPDLEGKDALVLEDFPLFLGPAFLISFHDADRGPRFIYEEPVRLGPRFRGDIGCTPAPRGMFLYTSTSFHDVRSFRYEPGDNFLLLRFRPLENGKLSYEKNPQRVTPYEILDSGCVPKLGSFRVEQLAARREGEDIIVSLRVQAELPARTYLTAVMSYGDGGGFHPWGQSDRQGAFKVTPVLLSDPGPRSGGCEWNVAVRVRSFPRTDRTRLEFFRASRDELPVLLGRAEAVVAP
jgi:hypothetical protein